MKTKRYQCSDLPRIVVDYKALIPAVEVLMVVDLHAQFLQHRLVSSLPLCMHRCTYIIHDAQDAWGILGRITHMNPACYFIQEKQIVPAQLLTYCKR